MTTPIEALRNEIKNRAHIYREVYLRLAEAHGPEEAARLLGDAIYARGHAKGALLTGKIGAPDLEKLAEAFAAGAGPMDAFGHEVVESGVERAVLRLTHCPLVEAWDEAGLSQPEKTAMCDIACRVDYGKFEGAGYSLKFKCRIADGSRTCDMELTKA